MFLRLSSPPLALDAFEFDWQCRWKTFFFFLSLCLVINRTLTLLVTFSRAKRVYQAHKGQRLTTPKSTRRINVKTAVIGVGGGVVVWTISGVIIYFTQAIFWTVSFFNAAVFLLMIGATFYIVVRVKCSRSSTNGSRSKSSVKEDFRRLVISVAVVFCICSLVTLVATALAAGTEFGIRDSGFAETSIRRLVFWDCIATIFNSLTNLFIYVIASKRFRLSLFRLFAFAYSAKPSNSLSQPSNSLSLKPLSVGSSNN